MTVIGALEDTGGTRPGRVRRPSRVCRNHGFVACTLDRRRPGGSLRRRWPSWWRARLRAWNTGRGAGTPSGRSGSTRCWPACVRRRWRARWCGPSPGRPPSTSWPGSTGPSSSGASSGSWPTAAGGSTTTPPPSPARGTRPCSPPAPASTPSSASTGARPTPPSASSARPATTPPTPSPWASACSTTWPSPRRRWPTGASGWRSSTGTPTTATAPRTSSTPTAASSTCRPTSGRFYPGTGRLQETGTGDGEGPTVNLPFPAGPRATPTGPRSTRSSGRWPSASPPPGCSSPLGFDAHRADPLAASACPPATTGGCSAGRVALAPAAGRTIAFLEGGYDLDALTTSAAASVAGLDGVTFEPEPPTTGGPGRDVVAAARRIHTWERPAADGPVPSLSPWSPSGCSRFSTPPRPSPSASPPPATACTWWAAASATPSSAARSTQRPRLHHRRPPRRHRGHRPGLGRRRLGPGPALRHHRGQEGRRRLRDHHPPGRGLLARLPQARGGLRRRRRGRPLPPRLHRQRHGPASWAPATGRADRPLRRAWPTWPPTGCARRCRPRSPSPTTPCACCGPPGSSPATASRPTPELVDAVSRLRGRLEIVSAERIRDELDKLMVVDDAGRRACGSWSTPAWPTSSCPSCRPSPSSRTRSTATRTCWPTPSPWSRRPAPTGSCAWPPSSTTSASPRPAPSAPSGVSFHHHEVVGARMADDRHAGPALPDGRDRRRHAGWSSSTCASTASAPAGPTAPSAATPATPARCWTSSTS